MVTVASARLLYSGRLLGASYAVFLNVFVTICYKRNMVWHPPWPKARRDAIAGMRWRYRLVFDNGKGTADTMLEHQDSGFKPVSLCELIRSERKSDGADVSKRYG